MLRTYPLHPEPPRRPDSLRVIFRRLEREIAQQPPRRHQTSGAATVRSAFPF